MAELTPLPCFISLYWCSHFDQEDINSLLLDAQRNKKLPILVTHLPYPKSEFDTLLGREDIDKILVISTRSTKTVAKLPNGSIIEIDMWVRQRSATKLGIAEALTNITGWSYTPEHMLEHHKSVFDEMAVPDGNSALMRKAKTELQKLNRRLTAPTNSS